MKTSDPDLVLVRTAVLAGAVVLAVLRLRDLEALPYPTREENSQVDLLGVAVARLSAELERRREAAA